MKDMDAAQARDELIKIAHTIAKQQRGEDHLQDFDTIRIKLLHEYQEFTEAKATKSRLDMLSELADLVYYSCQEWHHDQDQRDLDSTVAYLAQQAGVTTEQAYTAALAKYRLRSAKKDFEAENAAIEAALQEG
jgi:hypothetical protein